MKDTVVNMSTDFFEFVTDQMTNTPSMLFLIYTFVLLNVVCVCVCVLMCVNVYIYKPLPRTSCALSQALPSLLSVLRLTFAGTYFHTSYQNRCC